MEYSSRARKGANKVICKISILWYYKNIYIFEVGKQGIDESILF